MDLGRLNPAQREAVTHGDAPLLVLAGAGTGKTTVITYRIAHLLHERGVHPERVLAVTFTNKAAREMRERSGELARLDPRALDIGTFHGMCGRILRRYGYRLGLTPGFLIYDEDDQLALIKQCMTAIGVDAQAFAPQAIRHAIENWKNKGETPDKATAGNFDMLERKALDIYRIYEKALVKSNAVDFGDMLLHTVTLLAGDAEVRQLLQTRWSHVLVDEYQDTNHVQYLMLRHLCTAAHSLTVVGDDDQSIYRWRGADIGNILRFERDFPGASVVRLEQNYRSTKRILDAANAVIAHNVSRKGKTLFTDGDLGQKLELKLYASERDEGEGVAQSVERALAQGFGPGDVALLYRTNAQSRPLEDALRRRRIPYAVFGGVRFYDRKEIKDALAWLRLIANPASDVDFVRAIGAPSRGVGKTSLERLADVAGTAEVPLLEAARRVSRGDEPLPGRARKGVAEFASLVDELIAAQGKGPLGPFVERVLRDSGYVAALENEKTSEAQDRIDNLSELVSAIDEYATLEPEGTLAGFLEQAALATDVDALKAEGAVVSLMSLHTAKGLEFKIVHLTGLEDGLFPHSRAANDRPAMEEERRLCYVGITRARERLHLSAARVRAVFGEPRLSELSRFVGEIPAELLEVAQAGFLPGGFAPPPIRRAQPGPYDELAQPEPDELEAPPPSHRARREAPVESLPPLRGDGSFAPGVRVFHASFGEGFVIEADGSGARQKLVIEFPPPVGRKVIVARFVDRR
jgi:DNA helicase-2/ATP-dependent DNA helicase PcrA